MCTAMATQGVTSSTNAHASTKYILAVKKTKQQYSKVNYCVPSAIVRVEILNRIG
jgi:hypothetical protein